MDWQAITHDAMRSVFSQVNNNLAMQNMAASGMQATNPGFADGGAPHHIQGLIPGKVNPAVADDTVIKAKRGEYIFPVEVVEALGGPEVLDGIVLGVKNKLGLPAVVGPAVGGIDSQGRHDAKGLQPGMMGAADSGFVGVAKDIGNGLYDAAQKIPGVPEAASAVQGAAELGLSPLTAIPRSTVSAVSNLIDGRPPDGILGSAFMRMTEAGKNADATKTGPLSFGSAFPQPYKPSVEPMVPGGTPSAPASTTAPKPKGLPSAPANSAPPAVTPPVAPAHIQKSTGKFGETKFSDGSGGFTMNEQNRLANVAMQDRQAEQLSNEQFINNANAIDPIFGMAAQASVARNNLGKYTADKNLAAHKYAADAGVTKATQTALGKRQEQEHKNRSELLKTHRDFVLSKTMPSNFEGQQEDIAKTLTDAADPQNNTGIYYGPGGGARAGIAANKQVMDALVAKWTKAGYQPKDAHARAVGDYASLAAAGKVKAAKPIPYLGVLPTSKIKQPEPEL